MPNFAMRIARTLAAVIALVTAGTAVAGQDEDFLAAREAFRAGDARRLDNYARNLRGYVLEPYVAYWQIRLRLQDAQPSDIRSFTTTYADTLLAERLRAEWLKQLGRTQQWELFDSEYPRVGTQDDVELTCYALQSRMRTQGVEALQDGRPLWFSVRETPESCAPIFNALINNRQLTPEDIWTRIRAALEAGQVTAAQRAGDLLPAGQAPDARILAAVSSNPAGYLDRPAHDLRTRAGRETVMFAVHRLARTSPQQAATQWTRLESRFSEEERGYVWGQIAYFGAMRHDPSALTWYGKGRDLSDLQLAWKVRASLRARSWKDVLDAINAMTPKEADISAWKYWKARALRAQGREAEAVEILKPLALEYSFYGQLALEELGERIAVPPAYKPGTEDVRQASQNPAIKRALAFYQLSLRVEGNREWIWAIRNMDDRQLLAAAEVARRNELYDRAINTADKTAALHDFGLRYLAPYRDVMKVHASQLNLDEAWVYGLIRQESRFITDARSRVGASGLMQLMPATAQWVARKMGMKDWRPGTVTDINTNISLGTYYLKHVLDTLDGQPVLASAAYNAGPGRARAWRSDSGLEGAMYAETIPFNETRDYVKKVMSNATYYANNFTQQMQSLRQRLGVINPRVRETEPTLADTP